MSTKRILYVAAILCACRQSDNRAGEPGAGSNVSPTSNPSPVAAPTGAGGTSQGAAPVEGVEAVGGGPSKSADRAAPAAAPCRGQEVSVTLVAGDVERQFDLTCNKEKVSLKFFEGASGSDETLEERELTVTRDEWDRVWGGIEQADWLSLPDSITHCAGEEWAETDKVMLRDGRARARVVPLCRTGALSPVHQKIAEAVRPITRKK